jgi:cytochrome c2
MIRIIVLALLLVPCGLAHADRAQQGAELFKQRCSTCHVVGHGVAATTLPHNFIDLTHVVLKHNDDWLRKWILSPHAVKPTSNCYTAGLDPSQQIDQLLAFFHARAEPPRAHAKPVHELAPPSPPMSSGPQGQGQAKGNR